MCQTRNSTNVKLIDFGLATKLDPNEVVKISTGTAEFAAPEIVEREPVDFYTDMWVCRCTGLCFVSKFFIAEVNKYFAFLKRCSNYDITAVTNYL